MKFLGISLIAVSVMVIISAVVGCENETITLARCILQCVCGLISGCLGIKLVDIGIGG